MLGVGLDRGWEISMLGMRRLLCVGISDHGSLGPLKQRMADWEVLFAQNIHEANSLLRRLDVSAGIIVVPGAAEEGVSDVAALLNANCDIPWIGVFPAGICTSAAWRELIVDSLVDFYTLPINFDRLAQTVGHSYGMARLREQTKRLPRASKDSAFIGDGLVMTKLLRHIRKLACVEAPVLISGESGSGKELAAQALHRYSNRRAQPFVPVNCGAIPASLIQSELFGYERGAFTGAAQAKRGMFESAAGGTLFLDEIADLSLELQTNLLRFLQEKTITRVGSTQSIVIDVRIIAATHVDLEEAVRKGRFREDLFYRLNVLSLTVPPLRERQEDVATLAQHFFAKFAVEKSPRLRGFSSSAIHAMEGHAWPGNVRELINRVRRAMVMAEGRLMTIGDLGLEHRAESQFREALGEARFSAERHAITAGLHRAQKNVSQAARDLGISRMTLYRLMAKHEITV